MKLLNFKYLVEKDMKYTSVEERSTNNKFRFC